MLQNILIRRSPSFRIRYKLIHAANDLPSEKNSLNLVFSFTQVHDLILRNPFAALNGLHRAIFRWGAKTTDHKTTRLIAV